ncbi:MAG: AmmeMemoRadiSam system protein B [Spirochaetales bacterium]|nr:AmmeMemoRadiSam system protein B [Spirochaetales bacterium]
MERKKMMLPDGWYPHNPHQAEKQFIRWNSTLQSLKASPVAGIAPHAGWDFSGSMAWRIINAVPPDCNLIIIAGGHLSESGPFLVQDFKALETPFGDIDVDQEMLSVLCSSFDRDIYADNTVEIMLPMIKYLYPEIPVLPVRIPPRTDSIEWGREAWKQCRLQNRNPFFLGSTDLSHYGYRFGYTEYGTGAAAKDKVREEDRAYLNDLATLRIEESLVCANQRKTACSGGAAAAAAAFAEAGGISKGEVADHKYSYEVFESEGDFVGYGSLIY